MSDAGPTVNQIIDDLTRQAVTIARERFNLALDFSMASMSKLGHLIDQARKSYEAGNVSNEGLEKTVQLWGAYLGETQRRNKGGVWKLNPSQSGDRRIFLFSQGINTYPFEQVRQKITGTTPAVPERDEVLDNYKPEKKGLTPRVLFIAAGIIITLMILVGAGAWFISEQTRAAEEARLRAEFESYFTPYFGEYLAEYSSIPGDNPDISGRVIVIDKNAQAIAGLQYLLDKRLQPANPEEVTIAAQLECGVTGDSPDPALSRTGCIITLVDPARGKMVAKQEFPGKDIRKPQVISTYYQAVVVSRAIDPTPMVQWLEETIR
ncbi:hypothetical protein hrd7_05440 [Leptolinea sp. HRD-7]|nr:hypothetical protein hrd7_05440 [Leptolinea sp. HRD-7]